MPTMVKPTKADRVGYYLFVTLISAFVLWIVLIRPLTLPADQMPFIFAYNSKTHQVYPHQQKVEYAEYTGGAILGALVLMVPVIINDRKHDKAMRLLWQNRNNIKHDDYMGLMDKLTYHVWRKGNSAEVITDLQKLLKQYKGRDMLHEEYGFSKKLSKEIRANG